LQNYHGNIVLRAYDPKSKKLTTEKEVPVSVLVGQEQNYDLEVKSLHAQSVENGHILSLDLYNSGNAFCEPETDLIIKDAEGKFVERVALNLPEGVDRILPLRNQRVVGIAKNLKSGKYIAEINIKNEGKDLISTKKEFKVEAKN